MTNDNEKLYITHSTTALEPGKVTVYDLEPTTGLPIGSTPTNDIDVGVNPFGIFFVSQAVPIPEPGTVIGLLAFSSFGLGLKRKKQS